MTTLTDLARNAAVGGLLGAVAGTQFAVGPAFTAAIGVMVALMFTTNYRSRAAYGPHQ